MKNAMINVDEEQWNNFQGRIGKGKASEKIRELISDFMNIPQDELRLCPYYAYKCIDNNCPSLGRLSLFEAASKNHRCLWCGNHSHQTFILSYTPFGEAREEKTETDGKPTNEPNTDRAPIVERDESEGTTQDDSLLEEPSRHA